MAGLGGGLIVFLLLALLGVIGPDVNSIALIFLQFLSLVVAGYVAGRFTSPNPILNGGMAGLALFLVIAAISIAASARLNPFELTFLGLVAAVLGSSGGALADWRRKRP
jgi:hypothetical protein